MAEGCANDSLEYLGRKNQDLIPVRPTVDQNPTMEMMLPSAMDKTQRQCADPSRGDGAPLIRCAANQHRDVGRD